MIYEFQCQHCFIKAGFVSSDPSDAPACCGGEPMKALPQTHYGDQHLPKNAAYPSNRWILAKAGDK